MIEQTINAGVLSVAYREYGPRHGWPCVLGHGFPYDVLAYEAVAPQLADAGARVIVPYLRGYGPTRFLSASTLRSGEQAALGADLLALLDALQIQKAVLAGYDWGGRACCVVSALWPERVMALVSGNSYNIQDIARSGEPLPAAQEAALWYQYFLHSERGRAALVRDRRDVTRQCWRMWSPTWTFTEDDFQRTAGSFDNPDFADVVVHSYKHRFGLVAGDAAYAGIERRLAAQPDITVPTIAIDGTSDGVNFGTAHQKAKFKGAFQYRPFAGAGHNLPQERPRDWVQAVLDARAMARAADGE